MKRDKRAIVAFRRAVYAYWRAHGRHDLPWRKTRNPYRILVSEVMLQQTQVSRALGKYKAFLQAFPRVESLADAPLRDVLKEWSGLGYNRRAKYLHEAAKAIVKRHGGDFKKALMGPLPGIGPYTRAAVRVFAFNEPHTMIETNIRAAYLHHFYSSLLQKTRIRDTDLVPLIEAAAEGQDPREWHSALMDYGAHLKRIHPNPTRKSAHYSVQTTFKGSLREARGAILKILTTGEHGDLAISQKLDFDEKRVRDALAGLAKDGLIHAERGSWRIA